MEKPITLADLKQFRVQRDHAVYTDTVQQRYVRERDKIRGKKSLRRFIERWRVLWLMEGRPIDGIRIQGEMVVLAHDAGAIQYARVYQYIRKFTGKRKDKARITRNMARDFQFKLACDIILPPPLLFATHLATKYGAGTDLALVRLFLDHHDPDRKLMQ